MNSRTPKKSKRSKSRSSGAGTREKRKQQTRQALLDAALRLLEGKSFDGLSLREVTREAGVVPTAFYRHFDDMEELGLALVEESFRTLRDMLRDARSDPERYEHAIHSSVEVLVTHVHENRPHFRFVMRERFGGVSGLRHAIRSELRLFASELATDLSRFPGLRKWGTDDLQMMAGLIVNAMVSTAEAILDVPGRSPKLEREIIRTAERQLGLITAGVPNWRPSG